MRNFSLLLLRLNSFVLKLLYFILLSSTGLWILQSLSPRTDHHFRPSKLDIFFTSVSAATVSSMSTVEMEVFSNAQLIVLAIVMFFGGEVFVSMASLYLDKLKKKIMLKRNHEMVETISISNTTHPLEEEKLRQSSTQFLSFIVLGYLLANNILGTIMVLVYIVVIPNARHVLRSKGLNIVTFSAFTTVSTFASCGFVPTNENMIVFRNNSGLLLILMAQALLGNMFYPLGLRFLIWVVGKFFKKKESNYLLTSSANIGFLHLLPTLHSWLLLVTVLGFIIVQFILFCSLEWKSNILAGLSSYQKVVGILFLTVNSRHAGETIVDLSVVSAAMLVLFIVMMYLPPYTSFIPISKSDEQCEEHIIEGKKKRRAIENFIFSQLSYLVMFVILVCITERKKMKEDPLNFNVLSIVFEVISAYGNVGFTMNYSCGRQLKPGGNCKDKWYGFTGKWSNEGKLVIIVVMIFGRIKNFNMNGGKAWKLL
ncbi:cation transporter HKT8-like [Impatiens glandulifera]|uniref:cation transporter HKT8-like n=1 Tax=Impatiens glandulifera TaxID=253017 RepID=UPI001FB070BD|nr:cation transporter HKT8-like [Impatiens glandulifera]